MGPRRLRPRAQAGAGGGPRRAIENVEEVVAEVKDRLGDQPPALMTSDATVHKEREGDRVVAIHREVVLGSQEAVDLALKASVCGRTINTSFVERQHGTDRHRNARKARKTYRFSKDWRVHEAMTYFTLYSDNFCWPVRTPRIREEDGGWQRRTPAMAACLADHVWSLKEWVTSLTVQ